MSGARFIIGRSLDVLRALPENSVDLVLTSPPFLALRSYLPDDDPEKGNEIGQESAPGEFLDVLLDLVDECARVLAPHGTLAFELGDTYSGSGGAGGDYNAGGLRDGQERFNGAAAKARAHAQKPRSRTPGIGWPLDKSLCMIPSTFAWSLAYGRNPWTGRELEPWRVRNLIAWCRPNPPVGALGDKVRPATSYMTVACKARNRWFDLDAVRTPNPRSGEVKQNSKRESARVEAGLSSGSNNGRIVQNPDGAPPLDYLFADPDEFDVFLQDAWEIATVPYAGAHYAAWPERLCELPIKAMCPQRVCVECGKPSRRVRERIEPRIVSEDDAGKQRVQGRHVGGAFAKARPSGGLGVWGTAGWSDCGHNAWRAGVVLDPFAGSGTTLAVATGHGRDAIGVDLDARNADLARERLGMFLTVEDARKVKQ